uniref:NADP-dependent oxidoreductase domain-containing protein n=1 Tax=Timema monikensis TaxID=170555 RepID=A0A7R9HMR0_9NEOP|nr:unnamed protein product [Timema monikensis]
MGVKRGFVMRNTRASSSSKLNPKIGPAVPREEHSILCHSPTTSFSWIKTRRILRDPCVTSRIGTLFSFKSCDDDSDSSLQPVDDSDCDSELEVFSKNESSNTEDSLSGSEDKSASQLDDNPSTMVHTSQVSDAQSSSSDKCSCYYARTDNVAGAAIGEITGWDADSSHWVGDVADFLVGAYIYWGAHHESFTTSPILPSYASECINHLGMSELNITCKCRVSLVWFDGDGKAPPGEVEQAVKTAIDVGYRHFDCAFLYANEKEIGSAIRSKISEGVVKREDLYITSKLWNTHHRPAGVLSACKKSLENFGLDYLDLYLLHWPVAFKEGDDLFPKDKSGNFLTEDIDYLDTYLAMEECVRQKLTRSIGVSNFNSEQVTRVLEKSSIKPVMNQVECHPYLQQKKLIKFCKDRDIAVTAYSPLGAPNAMFPPPGCPVLMKDEKLKAIGEKYGKSLAQMALRFLLQSGVIVIPKSTNPERLKQNMDVFDFTINDKDSKPGEVTQAVKDAIDAGYRHFDCAFAYGNEKEVGEALKVKLKEGVVKREDLFITSKLWNSFHRPDLVIPVLKKTLENLQLEYLDLYLVHWPMAFKEEGENMPRDAAGNIIFSEVDYVDTWKAMEEAVKQGLTRSIGISNFNSEQITRLLKTATIKPVTNQVECHPYLNQKKLIEFCRSKDIVVTGYSPLGSPDSPFLKPGDPLLLDDPKLKSLAKKYNKSPAQVVLRYSVQRGVVTIPKSVTKHRIQENLDIFDFELSKDDLAYLDSFDCNGRVCTVGQ